MSINALIGYLIVEIGILIAKFLGIATIEYIDIIILSFIVNGATIFSIVLIKRMRGFSGTSEKLIFFMEFCVFISMYLIAAVKMGEFRLVVLVSALVAISIELPFTTYKESLMISISAVVVQVAVSYYTIFYLDQSGSFFRELFITLSFLPALLIISYVAYQITYQKDKINFDNSLLQNMNIRLMRINSDLERANDIINNDIELATQVQKAFLPAIPENMNDWDIALSYKPKYGVSGDFYDLYFSGDLLRGIIVFDVSGHGVSSALLTMFIKPVLFRTFNQMQNESLVEILKIIDRNLSNQISELDNYFSCILLRFDGNGVEYANAGHPDLLYKNVSTGEVKVIDKQGKNFRGSPMGVGMFNTSMEALKFNVHSGDFILVYTDCLIESYNPSGQQYGMINLTRSLQNAPDGTAQQILDFILNEFHSFIQDEELNDDFTVILLKKK